MQWLVGGGQMGELIRGTDWSGTSIGAVEDWPQSLRSAISILLPSKAQICLFWGRDLVAIYNDAYRPTLGIKHPWALGRPAREVWSEFWEDVLKPLLEGVLETGEAFWASDHPFMLERHGYPEETYFDISYDPVRDESGRVGGVFCIVSETTGRVLGERRLRHLRDLGRAMAEARSVEEVFFRACGVLEANPHDLPFSVLLDAEGRPRGGHGAELHDRWPIERAVHGELVIRGAELAEFGTFPGGPWPEPAQAAVVLPIAASSNQQPLGFLVAGLSPRRALDDAYIDFLRLVASNIGAGIAAARALEEQRAQAEALARLDRAKTAFFSNVSHEFRTPLTLLLGPITDVLGRRDLPQEVCEPLEAARRNGMRLLKLVNTLLDFSRIEAGRAHAAFQATELGSWTAELASNFTSACEKAGLTLRVDCPPPSRPMFVDRGMWEKIVLNLLSNAFKFTFEGEIAVELVEVADGVELRVRDTGTGIPASELPRIFERFHRIEGAHARTDEGSGIGLAFVQEMVRMHGGELAVSSEVGRGTIFTIRLPFGFAHLPQDRVRPDAPPGGAEPERVPGTAEMFREEALSVLGAELEDSHSDAAVTGTRILVVDDNTDMRNYLARLLRQRWSVTTARNGREALERLAEGPYDLVLSDVMMPEVDGFELLQRIKSDPARAEMPVVLLSARAGEEARTEGLFAGADDYVVKPFSAQQLLAQVGAQLAICETRRQGARERERLLALEQLAKREAELQRENLHSLFMNAPTPIVILRGRDHVIELANPPACAVWGRTQAEVVGRPLFAAIPELRGQGFQEMLDQVLVTGEPLHGSEVPAELSRRDGSRETLYFDFAYTPLQGAERTREGILLTAHDVSAQVIARREINALRERAESASRAKDEFLAMLSHELRNPLAPIATAIQLIRLRGIDLPEIGMLERQMNHLKRLVDDLLDVSRITRGKIELRRQPVELSEIVARAMEMVGPLIELRAQKLDLENIPARGLVVDGDPERLAQVVFNLISNASKYSEPGAPILVQASRTADRVRLAVADQGVGIAPDMVDRVFDIFVQQSQTLDRSEGGLGLGLTIVRSLVQMHGGTVAVRSDGLGRGSEFSFELPLLDSEVREPARPRAIRSTAPARRILVVDDNVDAARMLAELLGMFGHRVEVAHNSAEALARSREFRPDVAFIDIGLPMIDGYDLARRLREQHAGDRVPDLLALTGYGLERDRKRSEEAGFRQHLVKPLDVQVLDAVLAGLAGGGSPAERV